MALSDSGLMAILKNVLSNLSSPFWLGVFRILEHRSGVITLLSLHVNIQGQRLNRLQYSQNVPWVSFFEEGAGLVDYQQIESSNCSRCRLVSSNLKYYIKLLLTVLGMRSFLLM